MARIEVEVSVIRKRSGAGESHIIHLPKVVYQALGRPRKIRYIIEGDMIIIEPVA